MEQNKSMITRFQDFLETEKGQTILNYLYSWGAAIVILGALFKLTHISGADLMLFIGMGTEVLTFIVNGFERQSSTKSNDEAPATAGGAVIIGGAPATGTISVSNTAPAGNVAVDSNVTGGASQFDADALNAMANIAAAGAAVAAAQSSAALAGVATVGSNVPDAAPQFDTDTLNAMSSNAAIIAQGNVVPVGSIVGGSNPVATAQPAVPVIDGKVDVPELQQVTQDYIEKLRGLTESFQHIFDQSSQLEASADEVERLSRNLTSINTIYEMHLKSLGSQIGNIDLVNEQTRRMAEQIEELNQVYDRMLQSMTVNMKVGRNVDEQNKEA